MGIRSSDHEGRFVGETLRASPFFPIYFFCFASRARFGGGAGDWRSGNLGTWGKLARRAARFPEFQLSRFPRCAHSAVVGRGPGGRSSVRTPRGLHASVPSCPGVGRCRGSSGGGHGSPDGPVSDAAPAATLGHTGDGGAGTAPANFNRPHLINYLSVRAGAQAVRLAVQGLNT